MALLLRPRAPWDPSPPGGSAAPSPPARRDNGGPPTASPGVIQSPFTAVRSILRQPLNVPRDPELSHLPSPLATAGLKRRISFDAAALPPRGGPGRPTRAFNTPVGKLPAPGLAAADRRPPSAIVGQSRRPVMQWDTPSRGMSGLRYGMKRQRDAFGLDASGGPSRRRPRVSFDSAVPAHGSRGTAIYGTPARAPARENAAVLHLPYQVSVMSLFEQPVKNSPVKSADRLSIHSHTNHF